MKSQTIALFGASGKTGMPFLKLALDKYHIKALVRNPSKVNITHPNLELLQGDILNPEDVNKTMEGAQAVVTLIGHVKDSPSNLQTNATRLLLNAMKQHNITRIITLTGGGVRDNQNDRPKLMDKFVVFAMKNLAGKGARNALLDGIEHAKLIMESKTDWTIIRGPMLTEDPAKKSVQVGNVGMIKGFKLTREDLAEFILNVLSENSYIHQMPFITNGK